MENKRIHDLLNDYAKKEIPDNMNLWNDLKTELTLPGRTTRTRSLSLVLAILLMLGAALAVYAVVNQQITGDLGVEGAREANLVTDLNLSQTIDGVTLTLAWAYADASRLAFGYSITAPEEQAGNSYQANVLINDTANSFYSSGGGGGGGGGNSNTSRESQYTMSYGVAFYENPPEVLDMRVEFVLEPSRPFTPDEIPSNPGAVLLNDVSGLGDIATEAITLTNTSAEPVDLTGWTIADQSQHLYTFPTFTLDPNATIIIYTGVGEDSSTALYWGEEEAIWVPGEILTLANHDGIALGFFPVGSRDNADGASSGGGGDGDGASTAGGGFGGGFGFGGYPEGTPQPGIQVIGGLSMQNAVGPFVFEFVMPYLPALQLTPDQTVEANGVRMTLDRLSVSPSTSVAHFCFNLPSGADDWMPVARLMAGDVDAGVASWGMDVTSTAEDTIRCGTTVFYAPYQLEPTTFIFTIEELQTSMYFTPEGAERFITILAEQGIEVEVLEASGEGFNYNLLNQPDGDVGMAIYNAMTEAFTEHHLGPWTFTVELPGMER